MQLRIVFATLRAGIDADACSCQFAFGAGENAFRLPSGQRGFRSRGFVAKEEAVFRRDAWSVVAVGQIHVPRAVFAGGADGLLHISEMSWGRVENPKKVFKVGETVKVLIKDINGDKIALSLKFPEENPWLNAADKYAVGNVVEGCVARMTDFGAFVELEPGVDALLHVSQISREHVEKPSDALKIGQEITAKVVDFNEEDKKISLSMKALENEEPVEE